MRQIKYRIWDNDNEVMEYINFTNLDKLIETLDSYRDYFSTSYFNKIDDSTGNPLIMQFTGLTDRNNIDVYEGDIIKSEHAPIGCVEWDGEQHRWGIKTEGVLVGIKNMGEIEVIDNIYKYKK